MGKSFFLLAMMCLVSVLFFLLITMDSLYKILWPASLGERIFATVACVFFFLLEICFILAAVQNSLPYLYNNESWRKLKESHGICACPKCMEKRRKTEK